MPVTQILRRVGCKFTFKLLYMRCQRARVCVRPSSILKAALLPVNGVCHKNVIRFSDYQRSFKCFHDLTFFICSPLLHIYRSREVSVEGFENNRIL